MLHGAFVLQAVFKIREIPSLQRMPYILMIDIGDPQKIQYPQKQPPAVLGRIMFPQDIKNVRNRMHGNTAFYLPGCAKRQYFARSLIKRIPFFQYI